MQDAFWGILIPFLGTSLGAGCVFFLKESLSDGIQRALTGFAAGVMVAASVWSLLIPAMEQAADLGRLAFFPAAVGFWLGILFLLLLDHLIPHLHQNSLQAEGPKSQLQRTTMMVLAVTLHNIPEGMAVGGGLCWLSCRDCSDHCSRSVGTFPWDRHPELPRGGHHLHAPAGRRNAKTPGVLGRSTIWHRRAHWGSADDSGSRHRGACFALSAQLCCRSHAVCGGGGTDPGNVAGTALKRWHGVFCGRLQRDDGAGCGAGVTILGAESEISFGISENA